MAWFGADPGGADAFGVSLLRDDDSFETEVVSCADEAMKWLGERVASIEAAGIDAPLWWSSGRGGDREADKYLRKRIENSSGTVQAANSLRGAALVQGVMVAWALPGKFPQLKLSESHPKALLKYWDSGATAKDENWTKIADRLGEKTDHERDALLGAFAAREGSTGRWTGDLTQLVRLPSEQNPATVPWGPVSYWWLILDRR